MNELAIHIEYLLLSRNCVIVPTLGAFVAKHTPARWIADENLFLPPVRNVHFDPTITEDPENVFIKSVSEINQISRHGAQKRCEALVTEFHKTLITEGSIDFGSIGVFTIEDDAVITMSSCECGVVTPEYYGLDALQIKKVEHSEQTEPLPTTFVSKAQAEENEDVAEVRAEETSTPKKPISIPHTTNTSTHVTFKVRRSVLHIAMAVAATIALFFIVLPKNVSSTGNKAAMGMFLQPNMIMEKAAELLDLELVEEELTDSFDAVLVDVTQEALNEGYDFNNPTVNEAAVDDAPQNVAQPEAPVAKPEAPKPVAQPEAPVAKPEAPKPVAKPEAPKPVAKPEPKPTDLGAKPQKLGTYCIVLASGVSQANAENFVNKLHKQGVKATVYEDTKMRRVIIGGFTSHDTAKERLSTLKSEHSDLSSAWVLQLQ